MLLEFVVQVYDVSMLIVFSIAEHLCQEDTQELVVENFIGKYINNIYIILQMCFFLFKKWRTLFESSNGG